MEEVCRGCREEGAGGAEKNNYEKSVQEVERSVMEEGCRGCREKAEWELRLQR